MNAPQTIICMSLMLLVGCGQDQPSSRFRADFRRAAEKRADYAKSAETNHVDFAEFYRQNTVHGTAIRQVEVGRLYVSSGQIVACDPFYVGVEFTGAFRTTVPTGLYSVVLCIGDFGKWGTRVAFSMIKLTDEPPVRWSIAETTAMEWPLSTFYGVDSGLGCFADATSAVLLKQELDEFSKKHPNGNYYDDVLEKELQSHGLWNVHCPIANDPHNVIMFASGIGDGGYTSYWGLGANGIPVCLVTDFQLFTPTGTIFQN